MEKEDTDLNRSDAKSAGLEKKSDATGGDPLAEATDDATSNQYVLHFASVFPQKKQKKNW